MDTEMSKEQFEALDTDAKLQALIKMVPEAKKEISRERKLLTLAKESPNAWLHSDFLELIEIKIQEKEGKLKLLEMVTAVTGKNSEEKSN